MIVLIKTKSVSSSPVDEKSVESWDCVIYESSAPDEE